MGAVAALLYSIIDPKIICLVVDSPFINLKDLAI